MEDLLAGAPADPGDPGEARLAGVIRALGAARRDEVPDPDREDAAVAAFRAARSRPDGGRAARPDLPPVPAAPETRRETAGALLTRTPPSGTVDAMLTEVPSPHDPHLRHLRRLFLAVVTASFLFLIPWIGYLSASLPNHHEVSQWRLAWVGFDAALIVVIGVTAVCAWRRLQIFIPWAVMTATLLCCDAWFDIVLDWNSDEFTGAVLTAVFAELPLALLLFYVARKVIRLTVIIAWYRAGRTEPVPPLSRLTMSVLTEQEESERERELRTTVGTARPAAPGRTPGEPDHPLGRPAGPGPHGAHPADRIDHAHPADPADRDTGH
ncbi:hypothetical protein [Actinacidiphila acididurans]|uniref:Integral membrane protein n=1 Tax=Actinacidiphila acididurans TaxID=2784346 RepID=A0ABS2TWX1_9ACTN|nr:hypothetical protein [Actinacidiphila acididurans]MBM9507582.1 hypothetical protein [Actinacidiphila acididurans]